MSYKEERNPLFFYSVNKQRGMDEARVIWLFISELNAVKTKQQKK